jgi:protein subunit release factor A
MIQTNIRSILIILKGVLAPFFYFTKTYKMKTIVIEIRDAEGGEDAKLLVGEMKNIYIKACKLNNFTYEVKEEKYGLVIL